MGTAAGLLAGAFTESTVIGTAGDAIGRLALSDADKTSLTNNIPVAYAVTYLVGTGFIVWFLPNVGPKLMGVNLRGGSETPGEDFRLGRRSGRSDVRFHEAGCSRLPDHPVGLAQPERGRTGVASQRSSSLHLPHPQGWQDHRARG